MKPMSIVRKNSQPPRRSPGFTVASYRPVNKDSVPPARAASGGDLTRAAHPCLWLITWDPAEPVATRPLAIRKDGTWYCYGLDITKNVWELFGSSGYIRTAYDYTPYGSVTSEGSAAQPVEWSSEVYDEELTLVYYNYRHYNPMDGRWINRDPISEQGGWNWYAFVGNSPQDKYDYVGLWIKVKEHTWCAEKNDTLSQLAVEKYQAKYNDWQCLWPIGNTSDHGYPKTIKAGDIYDASNLATDCNENKVAVSVVAGFGEEDKIAFHVDPIYMLPQYVPNYLATRAKYGATPITALHISGHGAMKKDGVFMDSNNYFTSKDVQFYTKSNTFSEAKNKKEPARCWFCRKSEVRLATCFSEVTALRFATHILRSGSIIWGTRHAIAVSISNTWFSGSEAKLCHYVPGSGWKCTRPGQAYLSQTWIKYSGNA